jgi:hypothetical protein
VIVFGWAEAGATGTSAATAASAAAPNKYFVMGCFPPSVALDAFVPPTVHGHRQDDYLVVFRLYALSSRRPTILASIGVGLLSETPITKQGKRILLRPGVSRVPRGGQSFCAMLHHAVSEMPSDAEQTSSGGSPWQARSSPMSGSSTAQALNRF